MALAAVAIAGVVFLYLCSEWREYSLVLGIEFLVAGLFCNRDHPRFQHSSGNTRTCITVRLALISAYYEYVLNKQEYHTTVFLALGVPIVFSIFIPFKSICMSNFLQ